MKYISVDVESSGNIHGYHSLLEIGAVDCDNFSNTFQCYIIPTSENWTDSAKQVNKPHDFYVINGVTAYTAMQKFKKWLEQFGRPKFVGFNAPFDYGWVNYYFRIFDNDNNPFGINALDIKAYAMGKLNLEWSETTKKQLRARGITSSYPHTHNALDDAIEQADIFNFLRKI